MRNLTLRKVISLIFINVFNIICLIITIIYGGRKRYFFLTFLTFWANSFYLFGICICDINLFFRNSEELEIINNFLRIKYFRYSCTFSITVVILYWNLVFLGNNFIYVKSGAIQFFFHCYLHGINTIFLLIDMFINEHEFIDKSSFDCLILSILYLIYTIIIFYAKYISKFSPYAFMKDASFSQLVVSDFIMYVSLLDCYQIFIWLLEFSSKKNKTSDDNTNTLLTYETINS